MKRAVAYIRVSTEGQAQSGESLELQRAKVEAMAQVQDLELVELVVDAGESAKSLNRPGARKVLAMVEAGEVDAVVVYKLDRLTRSVRDLADLLDTFDRRGVALVSVCESLDTSTAAGRLVLNVMASVAQWERETIGERTREALQSRRRRGLRAGEVPFGYAVGEDGETLIPDSAEGAILDTMRELRAAGYSYQAIADELTAQGYRTRQGGAWHRQGVHRLVRVAEAA